MSKIKTRETVKDIKVIDKAAVAGERMKNAFIRSKDGASNLMDDRQATPSEYAEDKVLYAAEDLTHDAVHLTESGTKKAINKGREAFRQQRAEKAAEKAKEHHSPTEPPADLPPGQERPASTSSGHSPSADTRPSRTPEQRPVAERSRPTYNDPRPQTQTAQRGYQPVSARDNGPTLYFDADRMVEQGREFAKEKVKRRAETTRQIKQNAEKIARQPERAVKTAAAPAVSRQSEPKGRIADTPPAPRQAGKPLRGAERPAQQFGRSTRTIQSSARGVKRSAKTIKQTTETTHRTIRSTERTAHTIKQTAKSTGKATAKTSKGTIKTSQRAVKTAQQTSKAAIKTSQAAAKTAQKTAQATAKAARAAAAAAKATARAAVATAKAAAKAIAAAVKAIIAGVKALIAAIAAGGWVAVLVIVIICLIALIVGSCFGIFFSSEDTGSDQTMYEVVREINTDYENELENIKLSNPHDAVEMPGSRAVWKEVLAVYAVKTTTDPDNGQEVATITDEKKQLLKDIFWVMNEISHRTDTQQVMENVETDDGNGNIVVEQVQVSKTILYITVSHKTAEEMAAEYGFTDDQKAQLAELLADENNSMWTAVLYGISATDEEIVAVALSQIGNIGGEPYWSWYGFTSRVEWCACFVSWCANECGYIENGIIPKFAGCVLGSQWFMERDQWTDNSIEPSPGMIIFFDWDDDDTGGQDGITDHVGIVERVENGYVYTVEGNSGDSCRQKSYPIGYHEIYGYGNPAY